VYAKKAVAEGSVRVCELILLLPQLTHRVEQFNEAPDLKSGLFLYGE
jgi:hypothetical protein